MTKEENKKAVSLAYKIWNEYNLACTVIRLDQYPQKIDQDEKDAEYYNEQLLKRFKEVQP